VATYNIHKGVRGLGPMRRLEIHNLAQGVAELDADLVFLQEVRRHHHGDARRFGPDRHHPPWPEGPQAEVLAPPGHAVAYRTNAVTRQGEHGNALLSRWPLGPLAHCDVSDHRFEQRGLLHLPVLWPHAPEPLHAIVVHLGLFHASRVRQAQRLCAWIAEHIPPQAPLIVAGDFNDWAERLDPHLAPAGLHRAEDDTGPVPTFPSRWPLLGLDRFYLRGLRCEALSVPQGPHWSSRSDHLPLVAELRRDGALATGLGMEPGTPRRVPSAHAV